MLGGLLLVGLLVAAFGAANVLNPELFAGRGSRPDAVETDGGTDREATDREATDRGPLKTRALGAACVAFGALVAFVAITG